MQIETNTIVLDQFGWTFRFRRVKNPSRVLLLLHGWTGDEDSMWPFTLKTSEEYAILAPRAPYLAPAEKGGYSWREIRPGTWGSPTLDELRFAADSLVTLVDELSASIEVASPTFDVIGFSQGGALATTLAALHPDRVDKAAVLSGFIPPGLDAVLQPKLLGDVRFFWSHGTKDELVPFERGQESIRLLEEAGADANFCQADIGHRVSKECKRALDAFLA